MAITEPSTARVLRDVAADVDRHAFATVSELPRVTGGRPRPTGNGPLDAIRDAAWKEGYADGEAHGREAGYQAGLDRGVEEGRAVGYREGQEAAHREAVVAVRAEVDGALEALTAATIEIARRDAVALHDIESSVVDLAIQLAESILAREIVTAEDPGREALARALALAPDEGDFVAHLHPDDLAALGEVSDLAPGRELRMVPDASVGRGGCLVEAGAARLDARLETAIARIREALVR